MVERACVESIAQHEGQQVTIKGWLYNKTDKGKLQFLLVRDGTGIIQAVVLEDDVPAQTFEAAQMATQESSIIVSGTVRADERAPGGYELAVTELEVVQLAEPYPITPKEHGVSFLMDHRHLWLRSPRQQAILKIRAEVIRACRDYFDSNGFTLVDTPILTPAACEGTSTLFETDYFGESAYLAQSGQLYSEASIAALGKVYCFGPTFRAEKSKTRRHLLEFWMVEPEMAYADLDDCMHLAEEFVAYIVQSVLKNRKAQLELLGRDTTPLERVEPPFPRMTYDEAVEILHSKGLDFQWGDDFGAPDETALAEEFERPVLVNRYPTQVKAFYMEPDPERPELSLSVDCLAPEGYGEIIGGGQRIADRDLLLQRIEEHDLPAQAFQWYLDLRRYGSTPHSGFGLGIERTVAWICGLEHIRETIPFPRMLYRIYP
ncbi:MAG: asparagine--tRNA ligase [Chloroflexi bacterium B3_Chlor]|nr:MAG: asparagine--tRNA ligase [Chloroflexi bacterium B3_Chlor]